MSHWLGMLKDWLQPINWAEQKTVEQFERLWDDQEPGHRVTFVSIVFSTHTAPKDDIKDIGLSFWSKHFIMRGSSYHWRVEEHVEAQDVIEFGKPDSFDHGTTQPITARDIETVLDDWVLSLSSQCEQLCLVLYGKQQIMTLERHWKSPVPVVVLDFEVVWRLLDDKPSPATVDDGIFAIGGTEDTNTTPANAGNQAYSLIVMLEAIGKERGKS